MQTGTVTTSKTKRPEFDRKFKSKINSGVHTLDTNRNSTPKMSGLNFGGACAGLGCAKMDVIRNKN